MKFVGLILSLALILSSAAPILYAKSSMVEVSIEVTEINDNKANQLGVTWPTSYQAGQVANVNSALSPSTLPGPTNSFPSLITVGNWAQYTTLSATLQLLENKGAAQILSKPKILTKSGTSAKVVVGGEIAIVATGNVGGTIEWKEYGIKEEVLPVIAEDNFVDLTLNTEISRLDYSHMTGQVNGAGGFPGIVKREARSFVKVRSGETITLAGLLETDKETSSTGIPLLSDIPVLGYLFANKSDSVTKTNILIFVTPRIVQE